jgi:hypothetical protein
MSDSIIDRRGFIVGAGAAAVAAYVPVLGIATPAAGDTKPRASLADWHVDDMWGVYPRPSEPIGYGRPHGDGELRAAIHPADLPFLA